MSQHVLPLLAPQNLPQQYRASITFRPRYEDITQDGRVVLDGVASALGDAAWRGIVDHHPMAAPMFAQGVVPILRRMVFVGEPGPFSALHPWRVDASMALAQQTDAAGAVTRLFLLLWAQVHAPHGSTYAPPEDGAPPAVVGSMFAEHVMTRLFAPPDQRRVTALPGWKEQVVAPLSYVAPAPETLLDVPPGVTVFGDGPQRLPAFRFLMSHTDSNQHVNSLMYPRMFEEAAQHVLRGVVPSLSTSLLPRRTELMWRKPFMAGDDVEVRLRCWEDKGTFGAAGAFHAPGEDAPRATVRMILD